MNTLTHSAPSLLSSRWATECATHASKDLLNPRYNYSTPQTPSPTVTLRCCPAPLSRWAAALRASALRCGWPGWCGTHTCHTVSTGRKKGLNRTKVSAIAATIRFPFTSQGKASTRFGCASNCPPVCPSSRHTILCVWCYRLVSSPGSPHKYDDPLHCYPSCPSPVSTLGIKVWHIHTLIPSLPLRAPVPPPAIHVSQVLARQQRPHRVAVDLHQGSSSGDRESCQQPII